MIDAFEKISLVIHQNNKQASSAVAQEIADLIRQKAKEGKNCVLGMATGSTPKTLYAELVRLHREEGCSSKLPQVHAQLPFFSYRHRSIKYSYP